MYSVCDDYRLRRLERTGYAEEAGAPRLCPCCGAERQYDTIMYRNRFGEIIGCESCVEATEDENLD